MMRRWLRGIALVAALQAGSGCGADSVTAPTTIVTPTTVTWGSAIGPGGAASRSVTTSSTGAITITLVGADAPLAIGIGIPNTSNSGCRLSVSVLASSPGTSIAADVHGAGAYCVMVHDDARNITKEAFFTTQIVYP